MWLERQQTRGGEAWQCAGPSSREKGDHKGERNQKRQGSGCTTGNGKQQFPNNHKEHENKVLLCFLSIDNATNELRKETQSRIHQVLDCLLITGKGKLSSCTYSLPSASPLFHSPDRSSVFQDNIVMIIQKPLSEIIGLEIVMLSLVKLTEVACI